MENSKKIANEKITTRGIRNLGQGMIHKWRFNSSKYSTTTLRVFNEKMPYNYKHFSSKRLLQLFLDSRIESFITITYGKIGFDFYVDPDTNKIIIFSTGNEHALQIKENVTKEEVIKVLKDSGVKIC